MTRKLSRWIVAVAALCAATGVASAQGLSVKGGLSYGNITNGGILPGNDGERSGFAIGLGAHSSGVVGLGAEVLYTQRGITSTHLDYIDVPVYLRLAMPAVTSPFAYLGPQLSFELKCGSDSSTCAGSGRSKVTYAGVIGAGVAFGSLGGFSIEGRYVYGLTDLKLNTISSSDSYKTRSFLLLAGIGF